MGKEKRYQLSETTLMAKDIVTRFPAIYEHEHGPLLVLEIARALNGVKRPHTSLRYALIRAKELFDVVLPHFYWDSRQLSAEEICLLNEVPPLVEKALAADKGSSGG